MRVKGIEGELRAGGRYAARLGAWSGEIEADGATITAKVADADPFWIERGPFTLALRVGASEWIWRGAEADVYDGKATIRAHGEREVERYG